MYDKNIPVDIIKHDLESVGAVVNSVFDQLAVMNIDSESLNFTQLNSVVSWEIDHTIELDFAYDWHQLRITSRILPLGNVYYPENSGDNISVYLMDSGVDITHPELSGSNIVNLYSYDNTWDDPSGHGTGLASLVVGNSVGVSPNAILKVVKIPMGTSNTTNYSQLMEAFNAILADHTTNTVAVINCSWVIPKSQILDTKILEMQAAGFVVVAAAGNKMLKADDFSPVGLDTVLGVAASDAYDRVISWDISAGSNWGPEVDITAPGIDVPVAAPDGTLRSSAGTSVSAAIVSAVAAQYIVKFPTKTAQEIQNQIIANAVPNVLFRDETIYSTTPNLLLQTYVETVFVTNLPANSSFSCRRNETTHIVLDLKQKYVESIEVRAAPYPIRFRPRRGAMNKRKQTVLPPWISWDGPNKTIIVNPPADLQPRRYRTFACLFDKHGREVTSIPVYIAVYDVSPNEVPETFAFDEVYAYYELPDSSIVIQAQASCPGNCTNPTSITYCTDVSKTTTCFCSPECLY